MKRLKRILVFALAQLGLISLHAQQPAPSGAQPVAPDSGGTGAKSPVSPAATSAAALLATNVPPRPMSYDEERTARDLLRAAKIQNAERRVPRDAFDNTFTIVPETDNKTFKLVPGNLKPAQTPIAGTPAAPVVRPPAVVQQPVLSPNATAPVSDPGPAWQPDPYEQE